MIQLTSSSGSPVWVNPQAIVLINDHGQRRLREIHLTSNEELVVRESVDDITRLIDQAILPILPADETALIAAMAKLRATAVDVAGLEPPTNG